jgi:hypothetical protein
LTKTTPVLCSGGVFTKKMASFDMNLGAAGEATTKPCHFLMLASSAEPVLAKSELV